MSNGNCINLYLHGMYLHGSVYTWIPDHGVSGKIFVPCSVLQHMPWQILSTSFHEFSKFERADLAVSPVHKELTVALAFLHFPGKTPQPPEHLTSGTQPVLLQLLGVPAALPGVCCAPAEQGRAAQELPGCG